MQIGRHCILCGQAGIAGSTQLGDYVVLAGQAGVSGHIKLGDGAQVAAKSAALTSVEPGTQVAGIPAVELRKWRRQAVLIARLEEMSRRLRALEKKLAVPARRGRRRASEPTTPKWDIEWIMSVLPHRYPILLVDRVLEIEPKKRIVAIKNVTINEPIFLGHFPAGRCCRACC